MKSSAPRNMPLSVATLVGGFCFAIFASMAWAGEQHFAPAEVAASLRQIVFGSAQDLPAHVAAILELRLWRALTTAGTGAALATSGALLQGVFRNGLAAPSIIGVTAGASLGATTAILCLSGILPLVPFAGGLELSAFVIVGASFAGSFLSVLLVVLLASERGRVSVPALLLTGVAVNACLAGLLSASQAWAMRDYEVSRAIFTWTFGNLDDKGWVHVVLVWLPVCIAACAIPRLAGELDLFAGGEDDARTLGVATGRTKTLAIAVASLLAASAVAVAGQIAFVGLVVPHLLRLLAGSSHRRLLPLSILGGAFFLMTAECLQLALLGDQALRPGVVMSLLGGPFFLFLLWQRRGALKAW